MSDPRDDDQQPEQPEVMDAGEPPSDGEELPDGSTIMKVEEDEQPAAEDSDFYENLAVSKVPQDVLQTLAMDLIHKIDVDKRTRELRDKQYEEGIRRTGLGKDAPGGADFTGASRAVHPMITEACIDFAARVMKEIFPPDGPVKDKVIGKPTVEKLERAKRKVAHMNHQFTEEMVEARSTVEQMFTQVPLGGSQYIKAYFDRRLKRPVVEFVPIDDVFLPFQVANFRAAQRKTHRQYLTDQTYQERVASGMYRNVDLVPPSQVSGADGPSAAERATEKVEGKEDPAENVDGAREVYETAFGWDVPEELADELGVPAGGYYSFLITIDVLTSEVLSLYRNWDEADPIREELWHLIEFGFIPWRGAYSIGLPHIIGGLSAAATGSLRALLDSAHINNMVTLLKMENSGLSGQQVSPRPTQVSEIKAPLNVTDIRMAAMPVPFNPPSPVLFALLEFIAREAKGVVRTSLDETPADSAANMPVGTQLSRVEQGLVVFSSIFARQHESMHQLMRVLHRINRMNLDDEVTVDAKGDEVLVYRADYEGPMDVVPVSDPRIFSEQQRFAQQQAVMQRGTNNPLYDQHYMEEQFLHSLKIPNAERYLIPKPEPHRLNQVSENIAMALGQPAAAFPDQDHLAHIQVLLDFMDSPLLGSNPLIAPTFLGQALEHLKQHMIYWYLDDFHKLTSAAAGMDAGKLMTEDPKEQLKIDEMLAHASPLVVQRVSASLQKLPPIIQKAQALLQQLAPPPPMDPTQATIQASAQQAQVQVKGIEQRAQDAAADRQVKVAKIKQDYALQVQKLEQQRDLEIEKIGSQEAIAHDKTTTAKEVAVVDALEDREPQLTDGGGIR